MQIPWSLSRRKRLRRRRVSLVVLFVILAVAGLTAITVRTSPPDSVCVLDSRESSPEESGVTAAPPDSREASGQDDFQAEHAVEWTISEGDTLTAIFEHLEISRNVMYEILSADEPLLALDVLRPGHRFVFVWDPETGELSVMELFIHPGNRIRYSRLEDGGFDCEEILLPGEWKQELLVGEISSSFYGAAHRAGLTDREIAAVTDLFRDQIQFCRDMREGDYFQVVRSRQFVDATVTGRSRIEGIRIFRGTRLFSAFLYDDGNYYDHGGESLTRALRRYPTAGHHRVTSHFNPNRRHPVTGRVAPHNGVDFAMPVGTAVLSTGDGNVTRVRKHPFAGIYVEIEHCSRYATRYLHLHRVLVREGQSVRRGERIALSGNSGRTTAPHLHFELHVQGRPVNPLTAEIPTAAAVPEENLIAFNRRVAELVGLMDEPSRHIALHLEEERT